MLKLAPRDEAMTTTKKKKISKFKSGVSSVNDSERSGRSSTSKMDQNVRRIKELVKGNRHITIHELGSKLGIPF
jgi:hypothetical protein